jgi:hypothetical protein
LAELKAQECGSWAKTKRSLMSLAQYFLPFGGHECTVMRDRTAWHALVPHPANMSGVVFHLAPPSFAACTIPMLTGQGSWTALSALSDG